MGSGRCVGCIPRLDRHCCARFRKGHRPPLCLADNGLMSQYCRTCRTPARWKGREEAGVRSPPASTCLLGTQWNRFRSETTSVQIFVPSFQLCLVLSIEQLLILFFFSSVRPPLILVSVIVVQWVDFKPFVAAVFDRLLINNGIKSLLWLSSAWLLLDRELLCKL